VDEVTPEAAVQVSKSQALIAQRLLEVRAAIPAIPFDFGAGQDLAMKRLADLRTLEGGLLVDAEPGVVALVEDDRVATVV